MGSCSDVIMFLKILILKLMRKKPYVENWNWAHLSDFVQIPENKAWDFDVIIEKHASAYRFGQLLFEWDTNGFKIWKNTDNWLSQIKKSLHSRRNNIQRVNGLQNGRDSARFSPTSKTGPPCPSPLCHCWVLQSSPNRSQDQNCGHVNKSDDIA